MGKIDKAILTLTKLQSRDVTSDTSDSRVTLLLTLVYLGVMLSVPLTHLETIILFGVYPIVASYDVEGGYSRIFRGSLMVLPLIACIGIFNPIFDRRTVFTAFGVNVSEGWVTFSAIMVRGLFAVQALLILIFRNGFYGMCHAMRRLGVPKVLTTQLMMVYRYLQVFLQELQTMRRARSARSFDGSHRLGLKMWGTLIGQLLIRTIDRARIIHSAMLARGFRGEIPIRDPLSKTPPARQIIIAAIWSAIFIALRIIRLGA